jgi:hypothetical protein
MKKSFVSILGLLTISAGAALAQTPDHQTPSRETICDSQRGAAFGLCNAYCEAMDCDSSQPEASPTACSRVKSNYQRITGLSLLPCEVVCPCGAQLTLFADIVAGRVGVQQCVDDNATVTSVTTPSGSFAIVNQAAVPPFCSVNNQEPFVTLTQQEAEVCRFLLRSAAVEQGVTCHPPE